MTGATVRIVPAAGFGKACLEALLGAVRGQASPVVGLPTGNTPVALYIALKHAAETGQADISSWRAFAIDEYGGPREHPCSNRAFFSRYWDAIPVAPEVEQFDPEAPDSDAECRRVAAALERAGGLTVSLLGIGMNGHLAFNEPGSALDSPTRRMELHEASRRSAAACWGKDAPRWGLTLGLRELLNAGTVLVTANGAGKAAIVAQAIDGPETADVPASLVRRNKNAVWVLDEAAAAKLRR